MADIVKKQPFSQRVKHFSNTHSNDIFLSLGIGLGISAVGLAVRGTVKAVHIIEEEKKKDPDKKLTKKEIFKKVWKCYIPTVVAEAASIACSVKSGVDADKAIAAATVAYKVAKESSDEYKEAAKEIVGEKKEKAISEKADQLHTEHVINKGEPVYNTGTGDTLYVESYYGHAFRANWNFVESCVNEINESINNGDGVSMNTLYEKLGLPYTTAGNKEGFSADSTGLLRVYLGGPTFVNGEPAHLLKYYAEPTNRYMD